MYHHPATMAAAAAAAEAAAVASGSHPSEAAAAAAAASRGFDPLLMAPSHLSAPKVIICCLCDFQAFSKGNLSFHLNNVHFKDKEFMCRMCHFKTAYKGALTRHVNSVHLRTGKTKECPICGYTTASLLNLNSHLSQTHHLDIATAFARPSNSTKGKPAPKPEKKDPRGPQSQQHAKSNDCGQPSPPSPNPTAAGAAPSHLQHHPTQPHQAPPHQTEMHGPSAAAAVAAKAATAAELVTQYNLAQLHAAYNELNRNRVAAAAAAQAMADHRASALQQAAAMTAAAAENSPPRSATYHREPQPSPPPQSAMRLARDVPEDLRDPSPTRSRILREQEILRNNAQQHSSRLYATNGIQAAPSPYHHHPHHHLAHNSSPPDQRRSPGVELGESPPRSNYLLHHSQSSSSSLYHRLQHQPSESPPLPPPSVSPVGFQCRLCSFQGRSATYLKNHYRTVHLDEVHTVACPHCEYTSDTRHDLDMHVDQEHSNNGAASPHPEGKETSVIAL